MTNPAESNLEEQKNNFNTFYEKADVTRQYSILNPKTKKNEILGFCFQILSCNF